MNPDWWGLFLVILAVVFLFGPVLAGAYHNYENDQKEKSCISAHGNWTKKHCEFDKLTTP